MSHQQDRIRILAKIVRDGFTRLESMVGEPVLTATEIEALTALRGGKRVNERVNETPLDQLRPLLAQLLDELNNGT